MGLRDLDSWSRWFDGTVAAVLVASVVVVVQPLAAEQCATLCDVGASLAELKQTFTDERIDWREVEANPQWWYRPAGAASNPADNELLPRKEPNAVVLGRIRALKRFLAEWPDDEGTLCVVGKGGKGGGGA